MSQVRSEGYHGQLKFLVNRFRGGNTDSGKSDTASTPREHRGILGKGQGASPGELSKAGLGKYNIASDGMGCSLNLTTGDLYIEDTDQLNKGYSPTTPEVSEGSSPSGDSGCSRRVPFHVYRENRMAAAAEKVK